LRQTGNNVALSRALLTVGPIRLRHHHGTPPGRPALAPALIHLVADTASLSSGTFLASKHHPRDTPTPHNVEILKDTRGEPTGVFLERNFVPVLEYTLFRDLPRFKYCDRVESVRLGAHAYVAAGTTSLYEIVDQTMRAWPRDRTKTERGRRSRTHCDGLDRFACPRHVQVG
jgi:predicted amidohydrolase YtcJ